MVFFLYTTPRRRSVLALQGPRRDMTSYQDPVILRKIVRDDENNDDGPRYIVYIFTAGSQPVPE
ncbi:Uncharacterized protein FWK35_00034543 [Aphis craccivora]|uniref:Uncharacterized protein n=1 Tax=Aphis craccivora TaxID=307492 RepID=A0A6G0ZDC8_APHCR|nr:Uncharacterized protein FWK35_00034543 [Aphis craccivora]